MYKFQPYLDAHFFLRIEKNMFLLGEYLRKYKFSSTFRSGYLIANPILVMKTKSLQDRFTVVAVVPVVVLVVLMLKVLLVVSRISKCSDMGEYLTMFKFFPHSDARIFLKS